MLHYLTVQDVLWINLEATRKRSAFRYATLEEATYYQYAYGESDLLLPQAARFLAGFLKLHPFDTGNQATAFIGVLAFLRANGQCVTLDDHEALGWFGRATKSRPAALEALGQVADAGPSDDHGESGPTIRQAIQDALIDFPSAIRVLADRG